MTKDDNGVIISYSYDDNDRVLTEGGFSYGYDNNGNLLSKTGNGEQHTFSYNALNQLVHADIDTGGSSSTVDYIYDHDGIRVGKTINDMDVTKYIVDKNRPYAQELEEQWSNGAISATTGYVYGDALISRTVTHPNPSQEGTISYVYGDALISRTVTHHNPSQADSGLTGTFYYHYDGMGSTRTLTDMTGTVTDTYSYDAYGLLLDKTGSTINPYLYRGEQVDADLSAYYLRARYYQPGIGRFMTTDPVEGFPTTPISLHRYVYGNDDPVNTIDPSGKMSLPEKLVVAGIVLNLAAMPIGAFTDIGQTVFSYLAKEVFPEAYIVGVNITGTLPIPFKQYLDLIFDRSPIPFSIYSDLNNSLAGGGGELVLSIGSGEGALFWTITLGGTLALPSISAGLELYDGFVFNLWNAGDYRGPFQSLSLNWIDKALTLFWDSKRNFDGPWGVSGTFLSKSGGFSSPGIGASCVSYNMIGNPLKLDRPSLITSIYTILFGKSLVQAAINSNLMSFAYRFLEFTTWVNIGIAHRAWNIKEPDYSIEKRRIMTREEVPGGYRSGPYFWSVVL